MKHTLAQPEVVFATDSILGRFGLGGPSGVLASMLRKRFPPALILARGAGEDSSAHGELKLFPVPAWRRWMESTRLGRFIRKDQETERIDFARWCVRVLPRSAVYLGENSTAMECLQAGATEGMRSAILYHNLPFRAFREDLLEERRRWGGPAPLVTETLVARTEAETASADIVIGMSAAVLGALEASGVPRSRLRRARLGVDCARFSPRPSPAAPFTIAFIGWLELRKGFPYLVEAFRETAVPGARLLLHGGTGILHHHDLVRELGGGRDIQVVHGPVEETLAAASIVALPSVSDGYGMAALEAMACGIPVIVSDRCGVAEDVLESGAGLIVPARSTAALREAMETLHGDPDRRRRMGEAGRRLALSRTWEVFAGDVGTIVAGLLDQARGARAEVVEPRS
jgi:starch synthase